MTAADGVQLPPSAHRRTRAGLYALQHQDVSMAACEAAINTRYDLHLNDGVPRAAQLARMSDEELVAGLGAMKVLVQECRSSRAMHMLGAMYGTDYSASLAAYARRDHRDARAVLAALRGEAERRVEELAARLKPLRKALR